ncbi:MAG: M17 family metallopeptidase [Bdellovibrionia bacterium]
MKIKFNSLSDWKTDKPRTKASSEVFPLFILLTQETWKRSHPALPLSSELQSRIENAKSRLKSPLKAGERLWIPGSEPKQEDLWIGLLPEEKETFFLLEFARDSLKQIIQPQDRKLGCLILESEHCEPLADALGAALWIRIHPLATYGLRAKTDKPFAFEELHWITPSGKPSSTLQKSLISAQGSHLARSLATLPPNLLNAQHYGEQIQSLAKKHRLGFRFYSNSKLKKMGAGAFTAVDQGDPDSAGGIYELTYSPQGVKASKVIHLAGKGLCFDTGGYDIKIQGGMHTMKGDMQGSAVALATLIAASQLKLPYRMKAFLAVTENHLSPKAYKADDVVIALNQMSIEVVNTDAEGRMVLADTLTLASQEQPDCLIDFATLTGSAIRSLGTKYSAGFTNQEAWHERIRAAGVSSGERVWTFPMDSTYAKALESKVADTLQCVKGPGPDHIHAAYFLSRFIQKKTPWVHIDLCAAENEGGIGHVDSLFTGFGVRWALEFIKHAF